MRGGVGMEGAFFSQTYTSRFFQREGKSKRVVFCNPEKGIEKTIVDDNGNFLDFPGIANADVVKQLLHEGSVAPAAEYDCSFSEDSQGRYLVKWQVQIDGMYWADDGFGAEWDDVVWLYTYLDDEGRFTGPFRILRVNSLEYAGTDLEQELVARKKQRQTEYADAQENLTRYIKTEFQKLLKMLGSEAAKNSKWEGRGEFFGIPGTDNRAMLGCCKIWESTINLDLYINRDGTGYSTSILAKTGTLEEIRAYMETDEAVQEVMGKILRLSQNVDKNFRSSGVYSCYFTSKYLSVDSFTGNAYQKEKGAAPKGEKAERVILSCLALAVIVIYLVTDYRCNENIAYLLRCLTGCFMAGLFYLSWKQYQNRKYPAAFAILTGFVAVEASFLVCDESDILEGMLRFALLVFPVPFTCLTHKLISGKIQKREYVCPVSALLTVVVCLAGCWLNGASSPEGYVVVLLCTAESILWSRAVDKEGEKKRGAMWRAWLVTLAMVFLYTSLVDSILWVQVHYLCWNQMIMVCFPLLCFLLFREIAKQTVADQDSAARQIGVRYFAVIILLCYITAGVPLFGNPHWQYNPDLLVYYLVIADYMFAEEFEVLQFRNRKKRIATKKEGRTAFGIAAAANLLAGVFVILANARLRTLLSWFGSASGRQKVYDWVSCRVDAARCFFSGNTDLIEKWYEKDMINGYFNIKYGSDFRAAVWQQGTRLSVLLAFFLIVLIFILFSRDDLINPYKRIGKYLAAGYLARAVLFFASVLFLFASTQVELPFTQMAMADIVVLVLLLRESK